MEESFIDIEFSGIGECNTDSEEGRYLLEREAPRYITCLYIETVDLYKSSDEINSWRRQNWKKRQAV